MLPRCKSCKHWTGSEEQLFGECRRFPAWVQTEPVHYCGEFKSANKTKPKKSTVNQNELKAITMHYCNEFEKVYGAWPALSTADYAAAKTLLQQDGVEKAQGFISEFLDHTPQWNKDKSALDLKMIPGIRNKLTANKRKRDGLKLAQPQVARYSKESDWPEYVDYVTKTGNKIQYSEWKRMDG